jgi:hypothetical protein
MADRGHSENRPWSDFTSVNEVNSSHIDVRRAEEKFNTLSRQLSNRSANTIRKSTDSFHDPGKGLNADEIFARSISFRSFLFRKREFKKEGNDWFAIFNPKVKRVLDVTLVHTLMHERCVYVRYLVNEKLTVFLFR